MLWRVLAVVAAFLAGSAPAFAGHTLTSKQESVVREWLRAHPAHRLAEPADCSCDDDIAAMRRGSGGLWTPVPDYQPYVATGDFNADGFADFAVVVVERRRPDDGFSLLVFNGTAGGWLARPAFEGPTRRMAFRGLFWGPPRPRPYRLNMGAFESDTGATLVPDGRGYRLE